MVAEKYKNSLLIVSLSLAMISSGVSVWTLFKTPSIVYVQNKKLLSEYKGLKDSKASYEKKLTTWQANLDTLSNVFKSDVEKYKNSSKKMTAQERKLSEELLATKEEELYRYKNAVEQKAKEEEAQLVSSSLNQINSFTQEFGKKNGYDFIIGITDDGNMLYGKEGADITENLLMELNNTYSGK